MLRLLRMLKTSHCRHKSDSERKTDVNLTKDHVCITFVGAFTQGNFSDFSFYSYY